MQRTCIGCGQTDDHPRHVVSMSNDIEVNWHMDCHIIAQGCEVCQRQLVGAEGLTGDALREHLTGSTEA